MGRDAVSPVAVACRSGRCAERAARILRCSDFCLQFTRVSLRRGLSAQRPQRCASKNLRRACRAGTRWVSDSGVDGRGSRGLDNDGGSRELTAGRCAGEFCRNAIPAWMLRIACGSNTNARAHAPTKTRGLARFGGAVQRWFGRYPGTSPGSPHPLTRVRMHPEVLNITYPGTLHTKSICRTFWPIFNT